MKLIKFTKSYPPYHAGEVAGFDGAVASSLVEYGVAVYVPTSVLAQPDVGTSDAKQEKEVPAEQTVGTLDNDAKARKGGR